jgi:hypothetical protein
MGFFDRFQPPTIEKMIAENNIQGLSAILEKPEYKCTSQEKNDRAKVLAAIKNLANEKNAEYLVQKILDDPIKNSYHFEALISMGKESVAVKPLITRLMMCYYIGGINAKTLSSMDFKKLRINNRAIFNILQEVNDKRVINPLLLALVDYDYRSLRLNWKGVIDRLLLFGYEAKPKLEEIISAPDSEIYLNNLIENLFHSYNVIEHMEPVFRAEIIWNKRVEYVVSMLKGDDALYGKLNDYSDSPYVTDNQRFLKQMSDRSAHQELVKNQLLNPPSLLLCNYAKELLEMIEKEPKM